MVNSPDLVKCPGCDVSRRVYFFPVIATGVEAAPKSEAIVVSDDASCFYHPKKKAVVPCASCGRFLCALCDVEHMGRHVCMTCLEKDHVESDDFRREYMAYDQLALSLSVVTVIFSFLSLLVLPYVVFLVIRHWNTPVTVFGRRRWVFGLALFFASLQLLLWGSLIVMMIAAIFSESV